MRGYWLKIWIASQSRSTPRSMRLSQAARCGNMRADQHRTRPMSRVRFAPSPTGALHIGGARTALYNWLLARGRAASWCCGSRTPTASARPPENVEQILDALRWLELDWDEGPVSPVRAPATATRRRSQQLLESGAAYATPRPARTSRPGRPSTATAATAASATRPAPRCACACRTRARPWSRT